MIRTIQIFGLTIFILSFLLFNTVTFWADYKLTRETVKLRIEDTEKADLFLQHASFMSGKVYANSFAFVSALDSVFKSANRKQLERFGITEEDINKIIERAGSSNNFITPTLDSVFRTSNEVGAFKNKVFREYFDSSSAQQFESPEELKSWLKEVATKVQEHGIISKVGFDRYAIRDQKYSLTKAATQGPVKRNRYGHKHQECLSQGTH